MKMLLTAVVMMIASPAPAQVAPVASHADHAAHAAQAPSGPGSHAGHGGTPAAGAHVGHDMSGGMIDCCEKGADGTMACCAKMMAEGKAMPCCDKMKADEKAAPAAAGADPHARHNMNPQ